MGVVTRRGTVARIIPLATVLLALFWSADAQGHGGVEMDKDVCILRLGSYRFHFTGYQPTSSGNREFCEDIPKTGDTIIVLDAFDPVLREYEVDFRLVENWTGRGNLVTFADLGSEQQWEKHTLLYIPPRRYETGSILIRYRFDRPGRYIGIVLARRQGRVELRSLFPFSVGIPWWRSYAVLAAVVVALGGGVIWFIMYQRKVRRQKEAVLQLLKGEV